MFRIDFFIVLLCIVTAASSPQAQPADLYSQPQLAPTAHTESSKAYARIIRYTRIDDAITYLNPDEALQLQIQPQKSDPQTTKQWGWSDINIFGLLTIAAFAVVIGLVVFLIRGPLALGFFQSEAKNITVSDTGRRKKPQSFGSTLQNKELSAILSITDRRKAFAMLTWKVLDTNLTHYGILRQSSWTAREALHHLSGRHQIVSKLRDMVRECEAVQFGNYPMGEKEFRTHVDTAQTLLKMVRL